MNSMYIGDVEITIREAIFSITIASMLFLVGFLISTAIEHSVNRSTLKYRQAAQIFESPDEFSHAVRTDLGFAFAEGDFVTEDAVSDSRIEGEHLEMVKTFQKYQMHTRVVHYYTGTGKTRRCHKRVERYWTWDTYSVERVKAKRCKFLGYRLPVEKFDLSDVPSSSKTVPNGFQKRIVFMVRPKEFNCTIFSELKDGTISDKTRLWYKKAIPEAYERETSSHATAVFWTAWSLFMAIVIIAFVAHRNDWLEDSNRKQKQKMLRKSR